MGGPPTQLAQTQSGADGRFALNADSQGADLYIVAAGGRPAASAAGGDNPAIALLTVLGTAPTDKIIVNEMTTIASVFTHNQFIDGTAIKGPALSLKIAASNVPNFVDLTTGSWGSTIQDPLNSGQTPTMANFATLANVLAGCAVQIKPDACSRFFAATTPRSGKAPADTLTALEAVARDPSYQPERLFGLLDAFYPVPQGKTLRSTPFLPYLTWAPSAWVFPLRFGGGGLNAPGRMMFDSNGNLWAGDNFIVGAQNLDALWDGNLSEFAPDGRAYHDRVCRGRPRRRWLRARDRFRRQCLGNHLWEPIDRAVQQSGPAALASGRL
jgi:hypothetical protein